MSKSNELFRKLDFGSTKFKLERVPEDVDNAIFNDCHMCIHEQDCLFSSEYIWLSKQIIEKIPYNRSLCCEISIEGQNHDLYSTTITSGIFDNCLCDEFVLKKDEEEDLKMLEEKHE